MRFKIGYLFLFFLGLVATVFSQVGELERYDCTYSKDITIPFNYSDIPNKIVKPQLNQVVFYTYRDQFTYWYKITSKIDSKLSFKISAINDSDSYVAYVYQYNGTDFCNKLFYNKVKPISPPYFIEKSDKSVNEGIKTFDIGKDNVYYISVLNTSLNNCGHYFILNSLSDTLKIKAYHSPCKKDISTISTVNSVLPHVKLSEESSEKKTKTTEPVLVIENTLNNKVNSQILDTLTAKNIDVKSSTSLHEMIKSNNITESKIGIRNNQIVDTSLISISDQPAIELNKSSEMVFMIRDKKKLLPLKALLYLQYTEDREYLKVENTELGKWVSILQHNGIYNVKCTALGYKDLDININFTGKNDMIELFLEPLNVGENFIMKSIYFHPNTYALRKESGSDLKKLVSFMTDNPDVVIEIQGHTNGDNKIFKNKAYEQLGEEWNFHGSSKKLSLYRAEAIKKYLINNGIEETRMIAKGIGGEKPIIKVPETMEEGQRNIRVEVQILKR